MSYSESVIIKYNKIFYINSDRPEIQHNDHLVMNYILQSTVFPPVLFFLATSEAAGHLAPAPTPFPPPLLLKSVYFCHLSYGLMRDRETQTNERPREREIKGN